MKIDFYQDIINKAQFGYAHHEIVLDDKEEVLYLSPKFEYIFGRPMEGTLGNYIARTNELLRKTRTTLFELDPNGLYIYLSPSVQDMTDYTVEELRLALPVIAVTAYLRSGDEHLIREGGCDELCRKPFTRESLLSMIGKYVDVAKHNVLPNSMNP